MDMKENEIIVHCKTRDQLYIISYYKKGGSGMNCWLKRLLISIFGIFIFASCTTEGTLVNGDETPKYKILVDKVMQHPRSGRVEVKEWMIRETADAGFTVYSPRFGHEKFEQVELVAKWSEKYDIEYMPWMRGTVSTKEYQNIEGKKVVWDNGSEQELLSPNSDEFWSWMKSYIVEYAKLSIENPALIGVFIDFENYGVGYKKNGYALSYDDIIMGKFAEEKGVQIPDLKLSERKKWLESENLHKEFSDFQIEFWRERAYDLRKAIDFYNPKFKLCIYPVPGALFIQEAVYTELATIDAPLMLADASTYGRPWSFGAEAEALKENRKILMKGMDIVKKSKIPYIYIGGINPAVTGADPEFSGKNALMISEVSHGYWVFYDGVKYDDEEHTEYMKWFKWANEKIDSGDFKAQYDPRKTGQNKDMFNQVESLSEIKPPDFTGETVSYPRVKLRGENLLIITAKAKKPVKISVQHHPVGKHKAPIGWELRFADKSYVDSGFIDYNKSGSIEFIPQTDGLYLLGISAAGGAYSFKSSNAPLGLYAAERLWVFGEVKNLYFKVPQKIKEFKIEIKSGGSMETVRVDVFNPKEELAATGQTKTGERKRKSKIITLSDYDETTLPWRLSVRKADEGVLDDSYIKLDPALPTVFSFKPEEAFGSYSQEQ